VCRARQRQPLRGWNIGFNGDVVPSQDDSSFIISAVDAVEFMLQTELDRLGVALPAVDQHRRYAFGYSMGGMMAYRIAHDVPDYLAALWVMAGAHGGRAHHGLTTTVANPPRGTMRVSLFAPHDHAELVVSDASLRRYEAAGLPTADAEAYAGSVLPLEATVQVFAEHNDSRRHRPRWRSSCPVSIRPTGPSAGPTGATISGNPPTRRSSSVGTRRWDTRGSRSTRTDTSSPRRCGTSSSTIHVR